MATDLAVRAQEIKVDGMAGVKLLSCQHVRNEQVNFALQKRGKISNTKRKVKVFSALKGP